MKHTPTPWHHDYILIFKQYAAVSSDGPTQDILAKTYSEADSHLSYLKIEQCEANAAFIVRACNAHEELLKAAKDANFMLFTLIKNLGGCDHSVNECLCPEKRAYKALTDAIAKAEKGE